MLVGKYTVVRYSLDGGETWIDVEVTGVQIQPIVMMKGDGPTLADMMAHADDAILRGMAIPADMLTGKPGSVAADRHPRAHELADFCQGLAWSGTWTTTFPPSLRPFGRDPGPLPHSTRMHRRQLKRARRRVERERRRGIL